MALMKMPCAVGTGGGIDIVNPDMVYPANGQSAIRGATTITCSKKPRYMIISNSNRQGSDAYYTFTYLLDVNNETCTRLGTYSSNHLVYTDSAVAYSDLISGVTDAGVITLNSNFFTSNTDSAFAIYY